MFLIYLAAAAGTFGSAISPEQNASGNAVVVDQQDGSAEQRGLAGKEAAAQAMKASTRCVIKAPTVDQMMHGGGDKVLRENEECLDRLERAPRHRERSVDDMVREAITGPDGIHMPPVDNTPVHTEDAMQAAGEAAYAEEQRVLAQPMGSPTPTLELGSSGAITGVLGLLVGVIATLALCRRRPQQEAEGEAATADTLSPPPSSS